MKRLTSRDEQKEIEGKALDGLIVHLNEWDSKENERGSSIYEFQ